MSSLIMMVAPTPARRDHHAGAHNVATLVPRHWEHQWAGTLDVSQPLLDADMERHHARCMFRARQMCATAGCSGGACTHYWLRAPQRIASCSVERGRLRVRNPVDLHYPNHLFSFSERLTASPSRPSALNHGLNP